MNVYVTHEEHKRLQRLAKTLGTSQSYVVRLIVRDALGLPLGETAKAEIETVRADMSKIGRRSQPVG